MKSKLIGLLISMFSIYLFAFSTTFNSIWASGLVVTIGYIFLISGIVLAVTEHEDNENQKRNKIN